MIGKYAAILTLNPGGTKSRFDKV